MWQDYQIASPVCKKRISIRLSPSGLKHITLGKHHLDMIADFAIRPKFYKCLIGNPQAIKHLIPKAVNITGYSDFGNDFGGHA
ncbi:hypothetical protein MNBD_ALPHA07-2093 [hydrothermal vent metagenome]|uniref:Uncharacterized protein n=1 Tax=hydrothermal vent metagenome TaxID=652676 RepID=A0A3B0SME9_9ZZZZ